jgi:hypothetical protein
MVDEYNRNPKYELKEIFIELEVQLCGISHNMLILMETIDNKFRIFGNLVALTKTLPLIGI